MTAQLLAWHSPAVQAWQRATGWGRWRRRAATARLGWSWQGQDWPHLREQVLATATVRGRLGGSLFQPAPGCCFLRLLLPGLRWLASDLHLHDHGFAGRFSACVRDGHCPVSPVQTLLLPADAPLAQQVRFGREPHRGASRAANAFLQGVLYGLGPEMLRRVLAEQADAHRRCRVSHGMVTPSDRDMRVEAGLLGSSGSERYCRYPVSFGSRERRDAATGHILP